MPRNVPSSLLCLALLSLPCHAQTVPQAAAAPTPACTSGQLLLHTDEKDGCFNGMSHSGTMVLLRNISATACTVQAFPSLTLADAHHRPLRMTFSPDTSFTGPSVGGKHLPLGHGPVALPVPILPNTEGEFALRWVSNEVYDHNVCVNPASLAVRTGSARLSTPVAGHICGPDAAHLEATVTRLSTDPSTEPCH